MAEYTVPSSVATINPNPAAWNDNNGVMAGDTLVLATGTRAALTIENLTGADGNVITIKNGNGRTTISTGGSYTIRINDCVYLHLTGTGSSSIIYGIQLNGFGSAGIRSGDETEHLEIDHIEITASGAANTAGMRIGPLVNETPGGFVMDGMHIHDCWIHGVSSEAMYLGHGPAQQSPGRPINNALIHDNICENCGWDGIQMRSVTANGQIYDNICRDIGADVGGTTQGGAGIIIGTITVAECYGNIIDFADRGIMMDGHAANCSVHHNVISRTRAIRFASSAGIKVWTAAANTHLYNNTVDRSVADGIKTKPGDGTITLSSNLVSASGATNIVSNGTKQNNCEFITSAEVKYQDYLNLDYRLTAESKARGKGLNGIDCGALPFAPIEGPVPIRNVRAFPTAQGAGAMSVGGRGSTVYKITTLADSGAGSFREACEASGARFVVFYIAGYITLLSEINITNPYISIYGQTAPGDGISIRGARVRVQTHDVVCRFIRFNPGPDVTNPEDVQALIIEYGTDGLANPNRIPRDIIFDHCTFRWGTDANVRLRNSNWDLFQPGNNPGIDRIERVTFQWCFFYECFDDVGSTNHSYNFDVGGGCTNISLHHNLFASCRARNPAIRGGTVEAINNIIFSVIQGTRFGGPTDQDGLESAYVNYIANREVWGFNTANNHLCLFSINDSACTDPANEKDHQIYPLDNAGQFRLIPFGDQWDVMGCSLNNQPADTRWEVGVPHAITGGRPVIIGTIWQAYAEILDHGGCKMPYCFGWDKADQRIVDTVPLHGGRIPSSTMAEVHGWPNLSPGYPTPADPDNDGIWSSFETAFGSNPAVWDADNHDYAAPNPPYRQPYTNIEVFGNLLAGDPHVIVHVDVN